jgi:hypothetical protein
MLLYSLPHIDAFLPLLQIEQQGCAQNVVENVPDEILNQIFRLFNRIQPFPQLLSAYSNYPFLPQSNDIINGVNNINIDAECVDKNDASCQNKQKNEQNLSNFNHQFSTLCGNVLFGNIFSPQNSTQNENNKRKPLRTVSCQYCLPSYIAFLQSGLNYPSLGNAKNEYFDQILNNFFNIFQINNTLCQCQSFNKGIPVSNHRTGWCGVLDHVLVSQDQIYEIDSQPRLISGQNDSQNISLPPSTSQNGTISNNQPEVVALRVVEAREYVSREQSLPSTYFPSDHMPLAATIRF